MIDLNKIDKTWTLFLDRDGVINHEKYEDYIHTWEEFVFYDGALEAIKIFAEKFNRVIIITNQKGVSKGVTKLEDLQLIHTNMELAINAAGGRIDALFYCTDPDDESPFRKPQPGMGLQAVAQFPTIDLNKTIMLGNTISDMQFGRNLGAYTIFLPTTRPDVLLDDSRIDGVFASLISFARALSADKL